MDVRYINSFIDSTKCVFSTMLDAVITIGEPHWGLGEDRRADVSAIIGLSGDAVGNVALCFPMTSAIRAASAFAGTRMGLEDEDFPDAVGELANMVASQAKSKFDGLQCSSTLPNVIIGKEHILSHLSNTPRLTLPCDSRLGHFSVEVTMEVRRKLARDTVSVKISRS